MLGVIILSCDEPEVNPESGCITFLLGDRDGFGIGLGEGDPLIVPAGTALPIDHRKAGDPSFTDIYPCDMGSSSSPSHQVIFQIDFVDPPKNITSAALKLMTLGIQDGDSQVYNSNTDVKLFLNDQEVPDAFDQVDQFDNFNGSWADLVSAVEIEIPSNILSSLNDGKLLIRIEIFQLNSTSQSYDAFAIDYCELEICGNKEAVH